MKPFRSRLTWLLVGLPLLALGGCAVELDSHPHAYYQERVYYPYGSRYLTPHRVYVPRDGARVIIRPDGHREYVYER